MGQTRPQNGADDNRRRRPEKKIAQKSEVHITDQEMAHPGEQGLRNRVNDVGRDQARRREPQRIQISEKHRAESPYAQRGERDEGA
jgi:hypothetical protein